MRPGADTPGHRPWPAKWGAGPGGVVKGFRDYLVKLWCTCKAGVVRERGCGLLATHWVPPAQVGLVFSAEDAKKKCHGPHKRKGPWQFFLAGVAGGLAVHAAAGFVFRSLVIHVRFWELGCPFDIFQIFHPFFIFTNQNLYDITDK